MFIEHLLCAWHSFSSCFHRALQSNERKQLTNTACAGQSVFATPHSFPPCSVPRRPLPVASLGLPWPLVFGWVCPVRAPAGNRRSGWDRKCLFPWPSLLPDGHLAVAMFLYLKPHLHERPPPKQELSGFQYQLPFSSYQDHQAFLRIVSLVAKPYV